MKTHPFAIWLSLFIAFIALSSCSALLSANFDSDTIGSPPNRSLPGEPAGDAMAFSPPFDTHLEVVNDSEFSSKALKFKNLPTGDPINRGGVTFRSLSTSFTKPIGVSWEGALYERGSDLKISIGLSDSHVLAYLNIDLNGEVSILSLSGASTPVGTITLGKKYSYLAIFSPTANTFNLTISTRGAPNITKNGIPFFTSGAIPSSVRPTFGLQFGTENVRADRHFIIDNLTIGIRNE